MKTFVIVWKTSFTKEPQINVVEAKTEQEAVDALVEAWDLEITDIRASRMPWPGLANGFGLRQYAFDTPGGWRPA